MFQQQSSDRNYNLLSNYGSDCPEKVKCQDAFSGVSAFKEEKYASVPRYTQSAKYAWLPKLENWSEKIFFNSLNFHNCKYNSSHNTFNMQFSPCSSHVTCPACFCCVHEKMSMSFKQLLDSPYLSVYIHIYVLNINVITHDACLLSIFSSLFSFA